jgi:hypothetical protein
LRLLRKSAYRLFSIEQQESGNIDLNLFKDKNYLKQLTDGIKEGLKWDEFILKRDVAMEDLDQFLRQLGTGFLYYGNEYKIKLGDNYNYIDMLLYNYIYKCFVVVELKVTELKKEHIGQTEIYMNYIDENVRQESDNKTIGLIVARENNEFVIKYSSDKRIKAVEYRIV